MAQTTITDAGDGAGFVLTATASTDSDEAPVTNLEKQAAEVLSYLRRNMPKAALACAVDLVNDIADEHSLNGHAEL